MRAPLNKPVRSESWLGRVPAKLSLLMNRVPRFVSWPIVVGMVPDTPARNPA